MAAMTASKIMLAFVMCLALLNMCIAWERGYTSTTVKDSANGGLNLAGVGGKSGGSGSGGDGTVSNSWIKQSADGGNVKVDNGRHLLWDSNRYTKTTVKDSANGGANLAGVGGDSYKGKAGDGTVEKSWVDQSADGGDVKVDNGRHLLWDSSRYTKTTVKDSANGGVNLAGVGGDSYKGTAGDGTVSKSWVEQSADGGDVKVDNGRHLLWDTVT